MTDINDYEFVDKENMHQEIKAFSKMISDAYSIDVPLTIDIIPKSILVCGMGGSGLPGDILRNFLDTKIMMDVAKDYDIPHWVDQGTLVFILSYSGNTEETIECYREASKKRAKCIVITSGGKLQGVAKLKKDDCIIIPSGHQPRAALPYLFFTMLKVLSSNKIISDKSNDVKNVVDTLNKDWYEENAKELALKLKGTIPIIYGTKKLSSAVLRWKNQIHENAKMHCFEDIFSEMDHNEICGYTHLNAKYNVIMLIDAEDSDKMKKRMDLTKDLIKSKDCEVTQIRIKGDSKLARLFSAMYLGDWTSFYLAVINEVDPTPVEIIEKLKKKL
jgi:glucose/mannose-6-phosphate isomerase